MCCLLALAVLAASKSSLSKCATIKCPYFRDRFRVGDIIHSYFLLQIYCCQWFGKENIICGGADQNMMRIIDRGTLNVSYINSFISG